MRWAFICQVVNGHLVTFGYIWMYLVYASRWGQNAIKKEIDTSQALIAAHPFILNGVQTALVICMCKSCFCGKSLVPCPTSRPCGEKTGGFLGSKFWLLSFLKTNSLTLKKWWERETIGKGKLSGAFAVCFGEGRSWRSWVRGPFDCNLGILFEPFWDDMTDMAKTYNP